MRAVIKRELKNYLKNPILWIGMAVVLAGMFQQLSPYLRLHYFTSQQELSAAQQELDADRDILSGCIPAAPGKQRELALGEICKSLEAEMALSREEAAEVAEKLREMDVPEIAAYLREEYQYYGAEYSFEDMEYYPGTLEEVNGYIEEKLEEHPFSWYFSRKFADFAGVFMSFFSVVLLAFLFYRDTRRDTYELLHTKPMTAGQYMAGKIAGGCLVILLILVVLNLVFGGLCLYYGRRAGLEVRVWELPLMTLLYVVPNMMMVVCVYGAVSMVFRNPLPAAPLLFLYIIYSNMGKRGPDGRYDYYGRALAIFVRFPGNFFEVHLPPMANENQMLLLAVSAICGAGAALIWKRRRSY